MVTPVALLTYAEDDPANASFFPFADYSPEYQAACWAVRHGAALRFIDLPALGAWPAQPSRRQTSQEESRRPRSEEPIARSSRDPIGALATAAGYDDGESWWSRRHRGKSRNPAPCSRRSPTR